MRRSCAPLLLVALALDILSWPSRVVEPLIALTIVLVGADNLLVMRGRASRRDGAPLGYQRPAQPADIRAWLAVAGALAWIGRSHAAWSARLAWGGSIGVVLAGLYWFVQRS